MSRSAELAKLGFVNERRAEFGIISAIDARCVTASAKEPDMVSIFGGPPSTRH